MPTTTIQNVELRTGEQFDVWVLKSSGKVAATFNIKVDESGHVTLTTCVSDNTKLDHKEM